MAGSQRVQADADRRAVQHIRRRLAGSRPVRGPRQLEPGAEQDAVRGQVGGREGGREDRGRRPAVHGTVAGRRSAEGRHHQGEHRQRDPVAVRRAVSRPGRL